MNSKYGFRLYDCKEWQWKDVEKVVTLNEKNIEILYYWMVLKKILKSIENQDLLNTIERSIILFHYCIVLNPETDAVHPIKWGRK